MSQEQEPKPENKSDNQNSNSGLPKLPDKNPVGDNATKHTTSETEIPRHATHPIHIYHNKSKRPSLGDIINSILAFATIVTLFFTCEALKDNSKQFRFNINPILLWDTFQQVFTRIFAP